MFILFGSVAVLIVTLIQFFVFVDKKSFGTFIDRFLKNEFTVNLVTLAIFKYVIQYAHFLVTDSYGMDSFLKYFAASFVIGIAFILLCAVLDNKLAFERVQPKKSHGARFVKVLSAVLVFLGSVCFFGTVWGKGAFGDVTADQLLVNLTSPTEGNDPAVVIDALEGPVFQIMIVTTIFCIFAFSKFNIVFKHRNKVKTVFNDFWKRIVSLVLAIAYLAGGIAYGWEEFQLKALYYAYVVKSDLIDSNYADPREVELKFPEKKRNLIHIYLESVENSYLSTDLGGHCDTNLMPELTDLSYEGMIFSNNDTKFGGPLQATGTQWSVASMVNQTTGLPMKVPDKQNRYGSEDGFLPGAYSLGDVLKDEGYEQTVMFGANADFGGLTYYYKLHGDIKIFDWKYAKENGYIPEDYHVWWGYEDDKLYEFAKEEITRMYETGKPFNFAMETADTHRPHGYLSKNAPTPYDDHYANAIAYSTSETVKFVRWIQEQPFYENTTIVLIGDHLSMDTDFFEDFEDDYLRTQYNLILNPAPNVADTDASRFVNRQYANFDLFPTIMASMGVEIEGDMLGIGTNLFSNKDTLIEQYGLEEVNDELNKKSVLYNEKILGGQYLPSAKAMKLQTTTQSEAKKIPETTQPTTKK